MLRGRQGGLSLVELLVATAITFLLLTAGIPSFATWIQDAQNRTAAESIMNALQLARLEAVSRNTPVRFQLTDASGRIAWNVGCVSVSVTCPATIQRRLAVEGLANARAGVSTADIPYPTPPGYFTTPISAGTGLTAGVSFNGIGQMVARGTDIARIDVTSATHTDARRFVVVISGGGQIRMCDPSLAYAFNPQGCS